LCFFANQVDQISPDEHPLPAGLGSRDDTGSRLAHQRIFAHAKQGGSFCQSDRVPHAAFTSM
jgi:hypothetical protein